MAMMCVPMQSWAAQVTFRFVHDGSLVTSGLGYSSSVTIYKSGEQIASGSAQTYGDNYGTVSIYIEDSYVGQNVVYMSSYGHQGTLNVTDGITQDLNLNKLTVVTKTKDGSALANQNVYIYDSNNNSYSVYTDYQGVGTLYLIPNSYTYKWGDSYSPRQSGNFDFTSDYELNLVDGESQETSSEYTMKFVCRYGDYPVSFSSGGYSFYIYRYGDKTSYVTSAYMYSNSGNVQLPAGSYWIKDPYGAFSEKIDVRDNMTVYLDYHKVTFVSKTGTTPNVGQTISFSMGYNTSSVTTNANGEASIYRLSGEYSYSVAGSTNDFTVGNSDKTVNINTSKVTISLSCDDMSAVDTQLFEWGSEIYNSSGGYYTSNFSNVTATDGKIIITTTPGNYKLRINGITTVDVNVKEGENNVSIKLYSLKFISNLSTLNSVYVSGNGSGMQIGFNTTYYLPAGNYRYNINSSYSSSSDPTFTLNGNKVIALNYGKVTVNVLDTNGAAASGISVNATGAISSKSTDANGQAILEVPYGTSTISVSGYESRVVNVTGDVAENFTIPGLVTFNVLLDGEPYNSYSIRLYKDDTETYVEAPMISNGVYAARITSGETWNVNKYKGSVEISEGSTVSLGTLTVGSDGMGVAFPMDEWSSTTESGASTFRVVVGSTVRLTAIPVKDDGFQCWVVNGNEIKSPAVDLKLTAVNTVAIAVFEGGATSASVISSMRGDVNNDGKVSMPDAMFIVNKVLKGKFPDEE